jgi:hypothetical protein
MRLARRGEPLLDADVELAATAQREPRAAARSQPLGLLDLLQAQQVAEEVPRLGFTARRRGDLDMI